MADNVAITAGSGTSIATDDVSGAHYQKVKLYDSTADSSTGIGIGAGTAATALRVELPTDGTGKVGLNAGTNAIGKLAANSGVDIGDVDVTSIAAGTNYIGKVRLTDGTNDTSVSTAGALFVGGSVAHDSPDGGNPLKVGMRAVSYGATPTAVSAADRADWLASRAGIPWVLGGHPNTQSSEYYTTGAQTDDNIMPAISTGTIYVITQITVTCSAANTVNTSVRIGFGTASVPAQGASAADAVAKVILSHPGIAPGSGVIKGNGGGIVGVGGDGEELRITCSAPTGGSLIVQVDWHTIEG